VNNPFVEGVKHLAPLGKSNHVVLDIVCNFHINVPEVTHKLILFKVNTTMLESHVTWTGVIFLILLSTQLMKCGTHLKNIKLIILTCRLYIYNLVMILGHGKRVNGKDI